MPPTSALNGASQASSSSRKRPHAEIARSQSRGSSPEIPSKRRRRSQPTSSPVYHPRSPSPASRSPSYEPRSPSPSQALNVASSPRPSSDADLREYSPPPSRNSSVYSSPSPEPHLSPRRFVGDGLDLRRPVMANTGIADTIDLTLDETPPPRQRSRRASTQRAPPEPPARRSEWVPARGPVEVIDLSDSDELDLPDNHVPAIGQLTPPLAPRLSSSPDIEFLGEWPAQPAPAAQPATQNATLPPSMPPAPAGDVDRPPSLRDFLSRGVRTVIGNLNTAGINFLAQRPGLQPEAIPQVAMHGQLDFNAFDGLQFDYERPAFHMGPRASEPPNLNAEPYKAPLAAKEGYTRDVEEEEIVLCPYCKDELAAGDSDIKQQVWVIKQCGHVYCGACATNRSLNKGKREKKKAQTGIRLPFRHCVVDGCEKSVLSKTAMFQIYL